MDYDEIPSMLQHYRFKRKMMDNLNQINAPSISNILNTISKQGSISQTEAQTLADTAVKSRDPNYISKIQTKLNTEVMDRTPVPYKPLIQAISDSLSVQSKAIKSLDEFDRKRDYYNERIDALPTYAQTGQISEILNDLRDSRKNLGEFATKSQYEEYDKMENELTEQLNYMNILTQYDSDPNTPEIDPPDKFDYPLDAQIYEQVERIRKGYTPSGNFAGGISELEKIASTDRLLERQAWAQNNLMTKEQARILLKAEEDAEEDAEKLLKESNKDKMLALKADKKVLFEIMNMRLKNNPNLDPNEVFIEEFGNIISQDNYANGTVTSEDFMHVVKNYDPYGENKIDNILDSNNFGSEFEAIKQGHLLNRKNLQEKDATRSYLDSIKSNLEEAQEYVDSDLKEIIGPILTLTDTMVTSNLDESKSYNAESAITHINRSILRMIESEDDNYFGVKPPEDILYRLRPLNTQEREQLDDFFDESFKVIEGQQDGWIVKSDPDVVNAMSALMKARDNLYKMIDERLLNQNMDIATGSGDIKDDVKRIGKSK